MSYLKTSTDRGVAFPNAVHKIVGVAFTKDPDVIAVTVHTWTDNERGCSLLTATVRLPLEVISDDPFAWAYKKILALPENKDAVPV
jgi:hypothetical protein